MAGESVRVGRFRVSALGWWLAVRSPFVRYPPPLIGSCLVLLRTDSGGEFDWGGTSVKR